MYFLFLVMKDEIKRIILYIINFVLLRFFSFGNFIYDGILDGSMLLMVFFVCGFVILFIIIVYFIV